MRYYLKKNYCNEAFINNMHDSKNLWKTIKKIIPSKTSSVPNLISNKSSKETANEFNKYFTSIGNQLVVNLILTLNVLVIMFALNNIVL